MLDGDGSMTMVSRGKVLVVDDDPGVTASLQLLLKQNGYDALTAADPDQAIRILEHQPVALVLQDMNFSRRTTGEEGLQLLSHIKGIKPHLPVVLITAWGSVELAVRGVKAGAQDFITKPWSHEQILHVVQTSLGLAQIRPQDPPVSPLTRAELDARYDFGGFIGQDPAILRLLEVVGRVAATDAAVLITGESGTGKELVAEAIWRNSLRRQDPFVKVNLGGIPTSLFESEMFGHVKGAFTDAGHDRIGRFEAARNGTLFLDEVGDLDPSCQVKLLRVLQDRVFERVGSSRSISADVRVVSATNQNLDSLIEAGRFREDLLYRLNLISVRVPPLCERRGDITLLARHFLHSVARQYGREGVTMLDGATDWLSARPWPGNVRQLKHLVERTVLLTPGSTLRADDFARADRDGEPGSSSSLPGEAGTLHEMERQMILHAIEAHGGNLTRVAEALGLSRGALYRRLEKHGITS